jgi:hypothetical protein
MSTILFFIFLIIIFRCLNFLIIYFFHYFLWLFIINFSFIYWIMIYYFWIKLLNFCLWLNFSILSNILIRVINFRSRFFNLILNWFFYFFILFIPSLFLLFIKLSYWLSNIFRMMLIKLLFRLFNNLLSIFFL